MGMRGPVFDLAMREPAFRRRMAKRLPQDEWLSPNINIGCVIKINENGDVLDALWDLSGVNHPMITSMRSDERRVGTESGRTCRSRWVQDSENKKSIQEAKI